MDGTIRAPAVTKKLHIASISELERSVSVASQLSINNKKFSDRAGYGGVAMSSSFPASHIAIRTSVFSRFSEKELGWQQCRFLEQINGDFVILLIEIVVWTPIFPHKISGSIVLILVASTWRQANFFGTHLQCPWQKLLFSQGKLAIVAKKFKIPG